MSGRLKFDLCAMTLGMLACATAGAQQPAPPPPDTAQPAPAADAASASDSTTVQAAQAADDANQDPAEIIVTARRVEEKLQDVPISITVFNQEQLSQRNVVSATDLANFTPSLSSNNNFGNENTTFAIRGFELGSASCRDRGGQSV